MTAKKNVALTRVQKAALVTLHQSEPHEQKQDWSGGATLINGIEFSWQTLDSLTKRGLVTHVKANNSGGVLKHYALTEEGAALAATIPANTQKPTRKSWKEVQLERAGGMLPARDLLMDAGCTIKSATLFDLMRSFGHMGDKTRKSSVCDELRKFAVLTEAGQKYGANIQSIKPPQTEMVFDKNKLPDLLNDLGEALIAQSKNLQAQV